MEMTDKEKKALETVERHLFTAPYNLIKQEAQEHGAPLESCFIRIFPVSANATGTQRPTVYVGRIRPGTEAEQLKNVQYEVTDFFGMIKAAALASAPDVAARTTIRAMVKIGGRKMREAFSSAAEQIAENLQTGESLILAPDEETESVRIALYSFSTPVRELERDFFLTKILGSDGVKKLIAILSRFSL